MTRKVVVAAVVVVAVAAVVAVDAAVVVEHSDVAKPELPFVLLQFVAHNLCSK